MKVIDMHCDTFFEILLAEKAGGTLSLRENERHIDLAKMRKGCYMLQNFAMFVPLDRVEDPMESVLHMIDIYHREIEANSDLIGKVSTYADIEKNAADGKLSAMLTIEEGGVCRGKLHILRDLYRLGVRMITLTWNFENELGYPHTVTRLPDYDPKKKYGLKDQGFAFVEEMERLGMIVDVSHLSDDGFYDVLSAAKRPFVASHSNARSVCPHTRNLTDDMLRRLADRGGLTGINFCGDFLDMESPVSKTEAIVRHIKHIVNVGGIACVGLGSDFDGIDNELELYDCSQMPSLADEMKRQGFNEAEIEAVFYKNVLNLYREILR